LRWTSYGPRAPPHCGRGPLVRLKKTSGKKIYVVQFRLYGRSRRVAKRRDSKAAELFVPKERAIGAVWTPKGRYASIGDASGRHSSAASAQFYGKPSVSRLTKSTGNAQTVKREKSLFLCVFKMIGNGEDTSGMRFRPIPDL
jgi:hypothetical protein